MPAEDVREIQRWFSRRGLVAMLDDTVAEGERRWRPFATTWSVGLWLTRSLLGSLSGAGSAMARALPILLGVVTFFFFTAEVWQSVGRLESYAYAVMLLLFVGVGAAFIRTRMPLDVDALAHFETREELDSTLAATPLAGRADLVTLPAHARFHGRQGRTIRWMGTASRLLIATVVAWAVFLFFLVLGTLAINSEVIAAWTGSPPHDALEVQTANHLYSLTPEHARVAGFLAVFSGFYYAVVSTMDPLVRQSMRDTTEDTVREAFAMRLVLLSAGAQPQP